MLLLELRITLNVLSITPSKGSRMASSNIRKLIIMLGNTLATVLTDIVGVCVGNRGVLMSNAPAVVGVLVFIDTSGGGRFEIVVGGMGVRFVTDAGGKFGLGVSAILG